MDLFVDKKDFEIERENKKKWKCEYEITNAFCIYICMYK